MGLFFLMLPSIHESLINIYNHLMVICLRKIFKFLLFKKKANSNRSFLSCLAHTGCVSCSFFEKNCQDCFDKVWKLRFSSSVFPWNWLWWMFQPCFLTDRVETSGYNNRKDPHGTPAINICHTINLIVSCPRQLSVNSTEEDVSYEKIFCHSAAWWDSAADNKKEITECPPRRDRREQWWRHTHSHQDWSAHHY